MAKTSDAIKVVHVEDNAIDRANMARLIENSDSFVLVRQFDNCADALSYIEATPPDLVIFDIHFEEGTSLPFAKKVMEMDLPFAFVSSHDQFALQSYDLGGIHYIVKPITSEQLEAIGRRVQQVKQVDPVERVLSNIKDALHRPSRIIVNAQNRITVLQLADVVYVQADGAYSSFYLLNGDVVVSSKPTNHYEEDILKNDDFIRVHRKYIINQRHLLNIEKKRLNAVFNFSNGLHITLNKFRREDLL
ncbi:LytR/AlgR family response regulator transcription factor [Flaviaesturariibacter amylovorans]|uniref:LytTR family DNA-binding domain-containing protein n=1 Tax=Flaviaesturariibacter amylovorans TaxID=1084520 RepID=A0ABP8H7G8_9BACT